MDSIQDDPALATTELLWGKARIDIEPSDDDPLHLLAPKRVLGASYAAGNQVLNPGRIVG